MLEDTNDSLCIPLLKGFSVTLQTLDADLTGFVWYPLKSNGKVYAARKSHGKTLLMHRVILSRVMGYELCRAEFVDHKDGNGLNNLRSNLRLATHSQNLQNSRIHKNNQSGYKGVYLDKKTNRWRAVIYVNKEKHSLGMFDMPEDAYFAYCQAAKEFFGDFANTG